MTTHILVIEDQINLAHFIALELNVAGYQVSVQHDGIAGLAAIQTLDPDIIVLSWELRSTSGYDLCRQLQSSGNLAPIVVLTAKGESGCRVSLPMGGQMGAQRCLVKPFSMRDLLETIELHLQARAEVYDRFSSAAP